MLCRIQQDRQRGSSVKTLRFPLSADFFEALRVEWHGTQRQAFALVPDRRNKNIVK